MKILDLVVTSSSLSSSCFGSSFAIYYQNQITADRTMSIRYYNKCCRCCYVAVVTLMFLLISSAVSFQFSVEKRTTKSIHGTIQNRRQRRSNYPKRILRIISLSKDNNKNNDLLLMSSSTSTNGNNDTFDFSQEKQERRRQLIRQCATERNVPSKQIIQTLQDIEQLSLSSSSSSSSVLSSATTPKKMTNPKKDFVNWNQFEMIFSSSVVENIPIIGSSMFLDGYFPNSEIVTFDFNDTQTMTLVIETLPFLPAMKIIGTELTWDEKSSSMDDNDNRHDTGDDENDNDSNRKENSEDFPMLSYRIKGKDTKTHWKILYVDDQVLAIKSSLTGYNILRRI